eukprot:784543-Amphidinium_carterae.1
MEVQKLVTKPKHVKSGSRSNDVQKKFFELLALPGRDNAQKSGAASSSLHGPSPTSLIAMDCLLEAKLNMAGRLTPGKLQPGDQGMAVDDQFTTSIPNSILPASATPPKATLDATPPKPTLEPIHYTTHFSTPPHLFSQ